MKPAQEKALKDIAGALFCRDFIIAKNLIPAATGNSPESLAHIRDAPRLPGLKLTSAEKLDFMLAVVPHGERLMKKELGDDCFQPSSETAGRFWFITETRPFIQCLLDISLYSADCGEWKQALQYTKRVLELNWGDNNSVRSRVPIYLINLERPMEALNFCFEWCDDNRNKDNPGNAPIGGFGDLSLYKKEDFDPESPQPYKLNTFGYSEMIYNGALASFHVYGSCQFSLSWLKLGYLSNKHISTLLLKGPSTYSTTPDMSVRMMGSMAQANDYIVYCGSGWKKSPGAREWLRANIEEIAKRKCDGPGCEKVEERLKEFQTCGGCKEAFYCGKECQSKDWKEGAHKLQCKRKREYAAIMKSMGSIGGTFPGGGLKHG